METKEFSILTNDSLAVDTITYNNQPTTLITLLDAQATPSAIGKWLSNVFNNNVHPTILDCYTRFCNSPDNRFRFVNPDGSLQAVDSPSNFLLITADQQLINKEFGKEFNNGLPINTTSAQETIAKEPNSKQGNNQSTYPEILYQVRNDYSGQTHIYDTFDNYDAAKEELNFLAKATGDPAGLFIQQIPLQSHFSNPNNITSEVFNN